MLGTDVYKRQLFIGGEGLVVAVGKHQGSVLLEIAIGKNGWIVGYIDREAFFCAHLLDCFNAGCDVVVDVSLAVGRVVARVDKNAAFGGCAGSGENNDGG